MNALAVDGKPGLIRVPVRNICNSQRTNLCLANVAFAAIAYVSTAASLFEPINVNAQEWVPRNAMRAEIVEPIAQASGPTHLVIQAPTPQKDNRPAHHGVPQIATPTYQESVGGGYWNRSDNLPQGIVNQDEMLIDDEFGTAELPAATPPKKKIDLTDAIPSHMHKTPRSIAIPNAHRTTGWKQPYSYGHFGAKHNRQLSIHHGHQRSYTQWTFR